MYWSQVHATGAISARLASHGCVWKGADTRVDVVPAGSGASDRFSDVPVRQTCASSNPPLLHLLDLNEYNLASTSTHPPSSSTYHIKSTSPPKCLISRNSLVSKARPLCECQIDIIALIPANSTRIRLLCRVACLETELRRISDVQ